MQQLTLQFEGYADNRPVIDVGTTKQRSMESECSHVGNKTFPHWEQIIPTLGTFRRRLKARELSVGWALRQLDPSAALSRVVNNVKLIAQATLCVAFGFSLMYLAALIGG